MVALKTELWITRGLSILTLIVIVFFSVVTIARENETMDEEQLNSFAVKEEVKEWDAGLVEKMETANKGLVEKMETADKNLATEIEQLKTDMVGEFDNFKENQNQLHDVQNSKIEGYHRTVMDIFELQKKGI